MSEQAALHVAHSLECQHVERHDDAVVSRRTALALHRQLGDRLGEGRDLYELAVVEQYREGPQAGLPYVHAAIEVLEGIDATVDLAVAYAAKAQMHLLDGTSQSASEWGQKALALLEGQDGAEECLAYALNTVASAQLRSQDRARSLGASGPQPRHRAANTVSSRMRPRAFLQTASLSLMHRRYADVEVACERGLAYSEAHDLDVYLVPFHVRHGYALLETGRWDAADARIATAQQAATLSRAGRRPIRRPCSS